MKKTLFLLTFLYLSLNTFSQVQGNLKTEKRTGAALSDLPIKVESNVPDCFCCGKLYTLKAPVINGPAVVKCQNSVKFTWEKCEGAIIGRNFSPFPPGGVGGGDDVSAFLNWQPGYTGTITFSISIRCGDKVITVQKQFKIEPCCDCSKLPAQFNINGPQSYCLSANCKDVLTYSAPNLQDTCFKYQWTVSPANTSFSGQGTNQIQIKCDALKTGNYKVTLAIRCGDKIVTNSVPLAVCKPASVAISTTSYTSSPSGYCVTLTPFAPASQHYWWLVEDTDSSGFYTPGELFTGPVTSTGMNTGSLCPSPLFNLQNKKHYVVYHMTYTECGEKGQGCWSLGTFEYKTNYPDNQRTANPAAQPKLEKISETEIKSKKQVPSQLLNKLPREVQLELEKCKGCFGE